MCTSLKDDNGYGVDPWGSMDVIRSQEEEVGLCYSQRIQ